MSFYNNAPFIQRNNTVSTQSVQHVGNNSAFKLCKNYTIQPQSSQTLCQKRMFQAYIQQQEAEESLLKKVRTAYNNTQNQYNIQQQQINPYAKFDLYSQKTLPTNIDINFNLAENVPLKQAYSVGSEPETAFSDAPSETVSDGLVIPDTLDNRTDYEAFFKQMHDNLVIGFQRQLEFVQVMKKMNSPELANQFPNLDKINPMAAGVLKEKAKMDVKTVVVMKDVHRMLKKNSSKATSSHKLTVGQVEKVVDQMMNYIKEGSL